MAILTIGLNPAIDRVLECCDFHIGGHQQATQIARLAAGKAANVNRVLRSSARIRSPRGSSARMNWSFSTSSSCPSGRGGFSAGSWKWGKTRENITILDPKRHLETHLRDKGFSVTSEEAAILEQKVTHELKPTDVAVFAGSLCAGLSAEFFGKLLDSCAATGARVVVDSSGEPLRAAGAHKVWLLKPNLEEFRQLVGVEVPNAAAALRDAATPLLKNVQNILVTRGPMGAVLLTAQGAYSARLATKETPRRTVGCGDHLLAGFVSEMTAGRDVEAALATAVACATARAMSEKLDELDLTIMRAALTAVEIEKI